jgi:hypothetical protein
MLGGRSPGAADAALPAGAAEAAATLAPADGSLTTESRPGSNNGVDDADLLRSRSRERDRP